MWCLSRFQRILVDTVSRTNLQGSPFVPLREVCVLYKSLKKGDNLLFCWPTAEYSLELSFFSIGSPSKVIKQTWKVEVPSNTNTEFSRLRQWRFGTAPCKHPPHRHRGRGASKHTGVRRNDLQQRLKCRFLSSLLLLFPLIPSIIFSSFHIFPTYHVQAITIRSFFDIKTTPWDKPSAMSPSELFSPKGAHASQTTWQKVTNGVASSSFALSRNKQSLPLLSPTLGTKQNTQAVGRAIFYCNGSKVHGASGAPFVARQPWEPLNTLASGGSCVIDKEMVWSAWISEIF